MTARDEYRAKCITAEEAIRLVQSGHRVALEGGAAEPQTLLEALLADHERLRGVELVTIAAGSKCAYAQPEYYDSFRVVALLSSPRLRDALLAGRADYIPCRFSEISRLFTEGYLPIDIALIQISPPDRNGVCSTGIGVDFAKAVVGCAKVVIAEVNERMPRCLGDCFVHVSELDYVVESSRQLPQIPSVNGSENETAVGRHIASLVEDRSTIQLGLGSIPLDAGVGVYTCSDGKYISISIAYEDHFWRNLCRVLGWEELLPLTFLERVARVEEIRGRLKEAFLARPRDYWTAALSAADVPSGPVLDIDEVVVDSHVVQRGLVQRVPEADGTMSWAVRMPVRFSATPSTIRRPAPRLGEHTNEVLAGLRLSEQDIAGLRQDGVV